MNAGGYRYTIYGLTVETNRRFLTPMAAATAQTHEAHATASPAASPVVRFSCVGGGGKRRIAAGRLIYASGPTNSCGESVLQIYAEDSQRIVRFPRVADFVLRRGEILCELCDPELDYMVEVCLLGHVLAYYLELGGVIALHAGAVEVGGRALLFAAGRSVGKSTVVASMVAAGYRLLADDIAALPVDAEVICLPAYPQLKLTPRQAERFARRADGFPLVHPAFDKLSVPVDAVGAYSGAARPPGAIYLLQRRPPGRVEAGAPAVTLQPLGGAQALMQLVSVCFLSGILDSVEPLEDFDGADLRASRLGRLARIAQSVPVAAVTYDSGYQLLPQLHTALVGGLSGLCRATVEG